MSVAVIKIGGALIQQHERISSAIREKWDGPAVLVHGGGVQITRMLERFGVPSSFIDGVRVTSKEALDVAALALVGEVHTQLVQTLNDAGIGAVGLFGAVRAVKRPGPLGFVGGELQVDRAAVQSVIETRRVPVIPTFAVGAGSLLNVNGDETAAAVAVAVEAARLIFITDVPGVLDRVGNVIESAGNPDDLLGSGIATGGMIPKLRSVSKALLGGVRTVWVGQTRFGEAE